MSIIRVKKNEKYFAASNEPFNDSRLSWEARGLMGYLLSKPDDWSVQMFDLQRRGPAGEHKLDRMVAELKKYGYINRTRIARKDGTFYWITDVYESPSLNPQGEEETIRRKSPTGNHRVKIHPLDNPPTGKPPHIAITESPKTELTNTERKAAGAPASLSENQNPRAKNAEAFEGEFGKPPTSTEEKQLVIWEEEFGWQWVYAVICDASAHSARKPIAYMLKIFARMREEGYTRLPEKTVKEIPQTPYEKVMAHLDKVSEPIKTPAIVTMEWPPSDDSPDPQPLPSREWIADQIKSVDGTEPPGAIKPPEEPQPETVPAQVEAEPEGRKYGPRPAWCKPPSIASHVSQADRERIEAQKFKKAHEVLTPAGA